MSEDTARRQWLPQDAVPWRQAFRAWCADTLFTTQSPEPPQPLNQGIYLKFY